jgi:hypothetical protein
MTDRLTSKEATSPLDKIDKGLRTSLNVIMCVGTGATGILLGVEVAQAYLNSQIKPLPPLEAPNNVPGVPNAPTFGVADVGGSNVTLNITNSMSDPSANPNGPFITTVFCYDIPFPVSSASVDDHARAYFYDLTNSVGQVTLPDLERGHLYSVYMFSLGPKGVSGPSSKSYWFTNSPAR